PAAPRRVGALTHPRWSCRRRPGSRARRMQSNPGGGIGGAVEAPSEVLAPSVGVGRVLHEITKTLLRFLKACVGRSDFSLAHALPPTPLDDEITLGQAQERILSQHISPYCRKNVRITNHEGFGASDGGRGGLLAQLSWQVCLEVTTRSCASRARPASYRPRRPSACRRGRGPRS